MLINLKVKTLDAQTHEFSIDNEITVREFKDKIAEKTSIAADQQRIIYCGRVLADEKQLKEYDVDGKVVHVAERPPPSQRGPSTSTAFPNEGGTVRRSTTRGMRNSPLFRALDGMVVGTMAIPMNTGVQNNGQMPVNPFTSSSSFCMNRITVARHMLECANNIAAYLEDPERGLNNTALDILARGRWTMESTVVEVGITAADLPQNQNIVEMVQGAVSAALRRNGNTNVTVVQLPTVFGPGEDGGAPAALAVDAESADDVAEISAIDAEAIASAVAGSDGHAAFIVEDVIDDDDDDDIGLATNAAPQAESVSAETETTAAATTSAASGVPSDAGANSSTTTGTNTDENSSRRRTGTTVLAEVVEQMRTVQSRLNPFITQFYELLQNEPVFEENDTTGRENAQRLYDRVSEAFHYMSHAQHAISDLMLDVSQPAPRYLTCRPILVEQSGYVSSNNYLSAAAAAAAAAAAVRQQQPSAGGASQEPTANPIPALRHLQAVALNINNEDFQRRSNEAMSSMTGGGSRSGSVNGGNAAAAGTTELDGSGGNSSSSNTAAATAAASTATAAASTANAAATTVTGAIEDPVDDPIVAPTVPPTAAAAAAANAANVGTQSNDNHQMQMARLIQAVVNSAPIDTEFHLQINAPSILSFGVPMNGQAVTQVRSGRRSEQPLANTQEQPQQQQQQRSSSENRSAASSGNNDPNEGSNDNSPTGANTSSITLEGGNQARVHTATLPTTATQTRSTARPQLQIGNMPPNGWNGRFIPANIMSSFDRFLPCNSHHIREPENSATNNGNSATAASATDAASANATATSTGPNTNLRNAQQQQMRGMRSISDYIRRGYPAPNAPPLNAAVAIRDILSRPPRRRPMLPGPVNAYRLNLRNQLLAFMQLKIFEGEPMNENTIQPAINRVIRWFAQSLMYLPQYEKPEYDARDSVYNILRLMLPLLFDLIHNSHEALLIEFEERLKLMCEQFVKRLYTVLNMCIGRDNAEIYWGQLMRLLLSPAQTNLPDESLQFIRTYINTDIPPNSDTVDAQQFIVQRNATQKGQQDKPTPMDTDVEMSETASTSEATNSNNQLPLNSDNNTKTDILLTEPLPNIVPGSEPWHSNFPNAWLPVITRDIQTQAENPPAQVPFSDAYISGMSAKRRKMIQSNKPPTDVSSLVADSVRKAIQTVGVTSSTASNQSQTPDEITNSIATDAAMQASYTEAIRANVRERLKKDPDYKADKYPQTTKFVNK